MSLRASANTPRLQTPQFTVPGGERLSARAEAKLTRWVENYRQEHPEMRGRTVHAFYRTGGRNIRVEFPPAGGPRRASTRGDSDSFARSPTDGANRPGLFSFLFGNRNNAGVTPGRPGEGVRPGPTRERAAARNGYGVVMANGGATRSQPIDRRLMGQLDLMARELGVRVEVFSGGQPGRNERGARTGSTRHDHGLAADVYVYQNGRRLTGNALAPIVDYWLRNNVGGVGYGMEGGGMHLDVHRNRASFWAYAGMPTAVRRVVRAELGNNVPALRYA